MTKLSEEVESLQNNVSSMESDAQQIVTCQTPFPMNDADTAIVRTLTSASNYSISKNEYNKNTQTYETAFVPCESCDSVQKNLREVGDIVISVCSSQGLPSSLSKYKARIEGLDWFTGSDVARWAAEQNKDLTRINKHLDSLLATIGPLKDDVEASHKHSKDMEKKMTKIDKDMKLEKETSTTERKQFKSKLEQIHKEHVDEMDLVRRDNSGLLRSQEQLSKQIETMKEKLQEQKTLLHDFGELYIFVVRKVIAWSV